MEPISLSSLSVKAAPSVMAWSAAPTEIFWFSPSTRPLGVSRFTAHQATCSGPNGVTGESEWMASGTPCLKAEPHASSRMARSGPMVRS